MTNLLAQMQKKESKKDNKDDDSSGQRIKDATKNSLEKKKQILLKEKIKDMVGENFPEMKDLQVHQISDNTDERRPKSKYTPRQSSISNIKKINSIAFSKGVKC